jgi:hypothetical protein
MFSSRTHRSREESGSRAPMSGHLSITVTALSLWLAACGGRRPLDHDRSPLRRTPVREQGPGRDAAADNVPGVCWRDARRGAGVDASRLAQQATFGPTEALVNEIQGTTAAGLGGRPDGAERVALHQRQG